MENTNEKDSLITEEMEVSVVTGGQAPFPLPDRVATIFPALSHRNFQYYFVGQGISLVGFWLQAVAMGWVSFQLTGSPLFVGLVATASGLPFLLFSTFAGVFIDKTNKQKLIVWTQVIEGTIAAILGVMVLTGTINTTILVVLAFLIGVVGSIDLPARQAFIIEMVGKKDLGSAISINIGVFNAARFIGPAVAGLLIAGVGPGWAFILNSLSYIPGILAILAIAVVYKVEAQVDTHPWQSLKDGINYSFSDKKLTYLMLLGAAAAIFIWPYQTLMPVVAKTIFGIGAAGLGTLLSAAGLGSLVGAIFTSTQTKNQNKKHYIFAGLLISTVSLFCFSLSRNLMLSHILLFFAGFGFITFISTVNTMVSILAPDQMRGRVIAVYLTMFVGMMPVGNFLSGIVAQKTSAVFAIGFGAVAVFLITAWLYLTNSLDHI